LTFKGHINPGFRTDRTTSRPFIRFINNGFPERTYILSLLYGSDSEDPSRWEVGNDQAMKLMRLSYPFLPSKRDIIEKTLGIEAVKGACVEDYIKLVKKPRFMAGILDLVARFRHCTGKKECNGVCMMVQGKGENMFTALQQTHLGSVYLIRPKGSEITVKGQKSKVKENTFVWTLYHNDLVKLIDSSGVGEYLLVVPELLNSLYDEHDSCGSCKNRPELIQI
jgi:hypothetical protein